MNAMIRVLIVDDQQLFREGLHTLLSSQPGIQVCGEAANGSEALLLIPRVQPDVILMDMRMPVMDGVQATRYITDNFPANRVIILTTFDDDKYLFEGLAAGAVGYLLKDVSTEKLVEAIQTAMRGEGFLQSTVALKVMQAAAEARASVQRMDGQDIAPLTLRELDILKLLVEGKSNKEIADTLFITEGTAKNHVSNVISKLGVRNRMQAVLKAKTLHLA